jgi:hypothetical protein
VSIGVNGAYRAVTDPDLVAKKLALIETYVRELQTLARPDQMELDVREERFDEHTLQLAVQAALDVASHITSDDRWVNRAPTTSCFCCWSAQRGSTPSSHSPCARQLDSET